MMAVLDTFFSNPAEEANSTKMSVFGLVLAADSMAQACLKTAYVRSDPYTSKNSRLTEH